MKGIGQLNEQGLHASLKDYYAGPDGQVEVSVHGYIIDVVINDQLIEIQTGNFSSIQSKLTSLVPHHPVRLVYPISVEKWLVKLPVVESETSKRRKSPKPGHEVALFGELVSFPKLMLEPNFSLELVLIQEEEIQRYNGKKRWRRRGWETVDRRLIRVLEQKTFKNPYQLSRLLPGTLTTEFTTLDIAEQLTVSSKLAQQMAYCLREMGAIRLIGKQGRFNLYSMNGIL